MFEFELIAKQKKANGEKKKSSIIKTQFEISKFVYLFIPDLKYSETV